jgi:fumarate reductase flavoprotein subunit
MVAAGKDELFGRPLDKRVELKAPFYAMRFWPKLHYCMGGIGINDQAQVISTKTCKPIPHLYAAGEITGGVHGLDRLGSCSSTDCLVMGRIAGRSVAANH